MSFQFAQTSRAAEVAKEIERLIRRRNLRPGDHIATKAELQGHFGAARATINEAIKLLLDRGRISVKPGPKGGVFAAQINLERELDRFLVAVGEEPDSVADAVAVRDHLESMILEEAAEFRTEADLKDVRRLLILLEDACGDEASFLNVGIEFHRRIGRISKNQILSSTYCGLLDFIESRVTRLTWPEDTEMSIYHHKRVRIHSDILKILETQDVSKIPAVVKEHHSQVHRE